MLEDQLIAMESLQQKGNEFTTHNSPTYVLYWLMPWTDASHGDPRRLRANLESRNSIL